MSKKQTKKSNGKKPEKKQALPGNETNNGSSSQDVNELLNVPQGHEKGKSVKAVKHNWDE